MEWIVVIIMRGKDGVKVNANLDIQNNAQNRGS
jgi:hypothetical protein